MRKVLETFAGFLAVVAFFFVAIFRLKTWEQEAMESTKEVAVRFGIEFSDEAFQAKLLEKTNEIALAEAEKIEARLHKRFGLGN